MSAPEKLTVTVGADGRVVLPEPLRDRPDWKRAMRLAVEDTPDGLRLREEVEGARVAEL